MADTVPFVPYSGILENVGAEAGDFKLVKLNVGIDVGRILGIRVNCTDDDSGQVTSFELAIWKKDRAIFDPESNDCIFWTEDITLADHSLTAGWTTSISFISDNDLTRELLIGIRMVGTATADDYAFELEVEAI